MGYIQGADRNQVVLLPETLDDYVGMENEVRVIDAFIDGLDIKTMGFKAEAAREGPPAGSHEPPGALRVCIDDLFQVLRVKEAWTSDIPDRFLT